ncbi:hypothetical protein IF1G_01863 [Cordyceps javanica]|uniref:Uncharacterized protein n=1 Tax=Cordyceps javanica TaxID=43265 RepID=A0A545W9Q9_9HYPO|nr:hypothetical protein IF1G_01863 [Cordyceps javanica]TQW10672.1 hypothetical protein IF2G_01614 [Cordyceps javanica]
MEQASAITSQECVTGKMGIIVDHRSEHPVMPKATSIGEYCQLPAASCQLPTASQRSQVGRVERTATCATCGDCQRSSAPLSVCHRLPESQPQS